MLAHCGKGIRHEGDGIIGGHQASPLKLYSPQAVAKIAKHLRFCAGPVVPNSPAWLHRAGTNSVPSGRAGDQLGAGRHSRIGKDWQNCL